MTSLGEVRWTESGPLKTLAESCTPQLPHSYYFTTRILGLKFMNKGVFFEEVQDLHFPRKRGYFGTYLREFGEKGVILYVQFLPWKGGSFGLKSQCFTAKKVVHFGLKNQCFIAKKGSFWAEKSVFCRKKGGAHLQNPPRHTNIVVTLGAFCYVWGCIIYYIQPNWYKLTLWLGASPQTPISIHNS